MFEDFVAFIDGLVDGVDDLLEVEVKIYGDVDGEAAFRVAGEAVDLVFEELRIWDDDVGAVEFFDDGVAGLDFFDDSFGAFDFDPVADGELFLQQNDDAGNEVHDEVFEGETDSERRGGDDGGEVQPGDFEARGDAD